MPDFVALEAEEVGVPVELVEKVEILQQTAAHPGGVEKNHPASVEVKEFSGNHRFAGLKGKTLNKIMRRRKHLGGHPGVGGGGIEETGDAGYGYCVVPLVIGPKVGSKDMIP